MWSTSGGKNHWAPQLSHEGDKRSLKIKKLKYRFGWPAVFRLNGYHVLDSKRLLLGRRGVEQSDSLKDGWADRFVLVIPGLKTCQAPVSNLLWFSPPPSIAFCGYLRLTNKQWIFKIFVSVCYFFFGFVERVKK